MIAMPGMRAFSLTKPGVGVSCTPNGVFVGGIPLLQRLSVGTIRSWSVRPINEIDDDLTALYRLPVGVAAKANALALIGEAFNRGDLAMAAIVAVQMKFPDPPSPVKTQETFEELGRRAVELFRCDLLKFWDPAKHPRAGTPPNPGWFAPTSEGSETGTVLPAAMRGKPWDKPDLLGGFGGGGGGVPASPEIQQPELPFPDGLPPQLAPYIPGGKTSGVLLSPTGDSIPLQSGYDGPAANMPPGSLGFDLITRSHVEGHAAALMWQEDFTDGTLYLNNPEICDPCLALLPRMLPPGATLQVVLPDGKI